MADATTPALPMSPDESALLYQTTTHERVLLAQAVFEKGSDDWEAVGRLLRGHALLKARTAEWFTAQVRPRRLSVPLAAEQELTLGPSSSSTRSTSRGLSASCCRTSAWTRASSLSLSPRSARADRPHRSQLDRLPAAMCVLLPIPHLSPPLAG